MIRHLLFLFALVRCGFGEDAQDKSCRDALCNGHGTYLSSSCFDAGKTEAECCTFRNVGDQCECDPGWTGSMCQNQNCVKGSQGNNDPENGVIWCFKGLVTGDFHNECDCVDCYDGWEGDHCHVPSDCKLSTDASKGEEDKGDANGYMYCNGHGTVTGTTTDCGCDCEPGYSGYNCQDADRCTYPCDLGFHRDESIEGCNVVGDGCTENCCVQNPTCDDSGITQELCTELDDEYVTHKLDSSGGPCDLVDNNDNSKCVTEACCTAEGTAQGDKTLIALFETDAPMETITANQEKFAEELYLKVQQEVGFSNEDVEAFTISVDDNGPLSLTTDFKTYGTVRQRNRREGYSYGGLDDYAIAQAFSAQHNVYARVTFTQSSLYAGTSSPSLNPSEMNVLSYSGYLFVPKSFDASNQVEFVAYSSSEPQNVIVTADFETTATDEEIENNKIEIAQALFNLLMGQLSFQNNDVERFDLRKDGDVIHTFDPNDNSPQRKRNRRQGETAPTADEGGTPVTTTNDDPTTLQGEVVFKLDADTTEIVDKVATDGVEAIGTVNVNDITFGATAISSAVPDSGNNAPNYPDCVQISCAQENKVYKSTVNTISLSQQDNYEEMCCDEPPAGHFLINEAFFNNINVGFHGVVGNIVATVATKPDANNDVRLETVPYTEVLGNPDSYSVGYITLPPQSCSSLTGQVLFLTCLDVGPIQPSKVCAATSYFPSGQSSHNSESIVNTCKSVCCPAQTETTSSLTTRKIVFKQAYAATDKVVELTVSAIGGNDATLKVGDVLKYVDPTSTEPLPFSREIVSLTELTATPARRRRQVAADTREYEATLNEALGVAVNQNQAGIGERTVTTTSKKKKSTKSTSTSLSAAMIYIIIFVVIFAIFAGLIWCDQKNEKPRYSSLKSIGFSTNI